MADIFVTTDLHLYSGDNDARHPYRSQREIDALAALFASTLHEDDLLIFLGDLCDPTASDFDKVAAFVRSIPCTKYMCKGNHDIEDDAYYLELGFDRVCDIIRMHNVIFSHKPVKVAPDEVNIHGHLHTQMLSGLGPQHINAYGARWNKDGPLLKLEDLIASATVQTLDTGVAEQSRMLKEFEKYTSLDHDYYQNIIDITDEVPVHPMDETAVLDDVVYQDTEDTAIWLKDDAEIQGKADKKKESEKSAAAIDESWADVQDDTFRLAVTQTLHEAASGKVKSDQLVFLSQDSDWDENVISPRTPDNFMTKNGYEDNKTPRVCFSTSIDKALRALSQKCEGMELYVYSPDSDSYKVITPTEKQVPYVRLTDEKWIKEPVVLKLIGKIKVIKDAGGPGLPYYYGDNQVAELYDWKWKWVQKWDDNGNNIVNESASQANAKSIVHKVHKEYARYKNREKAGNQNCLLCTWAVELQFRGENTLPRPVYSPRDIIFTINGEDIVVDPSRIMFDSRNEMNKIVKAAGPGSRFYVHVNWSGSSGGHEFIVASIDGYTYILDGQAGIISKVYDEEVDSYFDINYANSYMVRLDDRKLNRSVLEYNKTSYITHWDDVADIKYMKENNMLDEAAIGEYKNGTMRIPIANTNLKAWAESLIKRYHADVTVDDIILIIRGKEDFVKALAQDSGYSEKYAKKDVDDGVSGFVNSENPLNVNILERKYVNRKDMTYKQIVKHECAHTVALSISETDEITNAFHEGIAIYESDCLDNWMRREKAAWKRSTPFKTYNHSADVRCGIQVRNIIKDKGYNYLIDILKGEKPLPTYDDFLSESAVKTGQAPDATIVPTYGSLADVKKVVKALSDADVRHIYEDGFKEWPNVLYRRVYCRDDKPLGFIDVFTFPEEPNNAYIAVAVVPNERRSGLSYRMLSDFVKERKTEKTLQQYTVNALIDNDNFASIAMSTKFGFKLKARGDESSTYVLSESAVKTHPMDRDEKRNVAEKYGLRPVGQTHDAAEEDEALEREKRLREKEKRRRDQLAKARKVKKKKAFIRKVKSHLPGVHNEDTASAESAAFYLAGECGSLESPISESAYSFKMLDRVQFFDRVNEAASDDDDFAPVYVVLIRGNSPVSKVITTFTGSEFTHASITFDSSLTKMYSFAGKNVENTLEAIIGGFKMENIKDKFYTENDIPYAVYLVPSTKGAVRRMKKRLEYFIKNETKFTFDYLGLVKNFFKIPDDPQYTWFCSRFVADILNAGTPKEKLIDTPSLYRPEDFKTAEFAHLVGSGMAAKYNQRQVDRKTKSIENALKMKKADLHESAFYTDNPYGYQVLGYQLAMMDEGAVDGFIKYLKSFKIQIDNDGNILITRREYDQLRGHFRESLRMIKTCETAGSIEGVKDELCKINYMIELINQYYLREDTKNLKPTAKDVRKDMLDLRSVMMNAFRQHMTWVTTRDPKFNFQRYYDNHNKYGKNVMIPKKVVTSFGRVIITALA